MDKKLGSKKRGMDALAIRKACREYAASFIDVQRAQFRRLGVGGEWDRPYSTMDLPYEAEIARTFGEFYKKNLVYQALKSVRWCFTDQTALAEAELEYEERSDPAIMVAFPLQEPEAAIARFHAAGKKSAPVFATIWTTTPWTIHRMSRSPFIGGRDLHAALVHWGCRSSRGPFQSAVTHQPGIWEEVVGGEARRSPAFTTAIPFPRRCAASSILRRRRGLSASSRPRT
jgi:hypothetical protein